MSAIQSRYQGRIGERIGNLVFKSVAQATGDGKRVLGNFECSCGRGVVLAAGRVLNNKGRTHCGCLTVKGAHATHGMRASREYSSWTAMKARCLNPRHKDYPRWGGKGITVSAAWAGSFEAFLADVGHRPTGTSLDRIDGCKGYEPGNVRWATAAEQALNRSDVWHIEIGGRTFLSAEAAATHHGVSTTTIKRWCFGSVDARRARQDRGGVSRAKPGCRMWRAS